MKVTYAGQVIVDGDLPTGTVGGDLMPSGQQEVQVATYLRGDYAVPIGRDNRVNTIPLRVTPPPALSTGAALLQILRYFASLPGEGALIFEEDGFIGEFALAVLQTYTPARARIGVSNEFNLVFVAAAYRDIAEGDGEGVPVPVVDYRILEDGGFRLMENGQLRLME